MFVVFEGLDGSGKSTVIDYVGNFLESHGSSVVKVREPGGTVLGEKIRHLLLEKKLNSLTQTYLFFAARNELMIDIIVPSLDEGYFVLCDRFTASTIAYQCYLGNVPVSLVKKMIEETVTVEPDIVFYLKCSIETAITRSSKINHFDSLAYEQFAKVKSGYDSLINQKNVVVIDAEQPLEIVVQQIIDILKGGG